MTREESIEILKDWDGYFVGHSSDDVNEALNMAIKAIEQEPCETQMIDKSNFSQEQYLTDIQSAYDCGKASVKPCEDAISRQAAIRIASGYCHPANIAAELAKLPPVQPEPKTGHWIEIAQYSDGKHKIECSECGSHIFDRGHANSFNVRNKYKYCPKCGAKMWEGE